LTFGQDRHILNNRDHFANMVRKRTGIYSGGTPNENLSNHFERQTICHVGKDAVFLQSRTVGRKSAYQWI
jgi:hypothetical protein